MGTAQCKAVFRRGSRQTQEVIPWDVSVWKIFGLTFFVKALARQCFVRKARYHASLWFYNRHHWDSPAELEVAFVPCVFIFKETIDPSEELTARFMCAHSLTLIVVRCEQSTVVSPKEIKIGVDLRETRA